jgi:hypothetical protein
MQSKESPANAHNTTIKMHDFGCRTPAVGAGQLSTEAVWKLFE